MSSKFNGLRRALQGGTALLTMAGALAASAAAAQTTAPPASTPTDPAQPEQSSVPDIVVTGTLIKNLNLTLSSPVNVTSANEIQLRQANSVETLIRDIPGVVPGNGSAVNNGNSGNDSVDLRGLGSQRNVVLVDGERIVPTAFGNTVNEDGTVDLNDIPLSLVDRVEVLTGGASTTYGADAVSGVVNFVLKKNFKGVDLTSSQSITERGDAHAMRTELLLGGDLADGRGNVVLAVGYQKADPLYQDARPYSQVQFGSKDGQPGGSGTAVPAVITVPGLGRKQLAADGSLVPLYAPFNFNPYNLFQTPFEKYNIFAKGNYKISDAVEVYGRGLFTKTRISSIVAPSGVFGASLGIPLSNPYLPATTRAAFCANGDFDPNTPGIQSLTPAQCSAAAGATSPSDPAYKVFNGTVARRMPETGSRVSMFETTVFDYRAGVRGALSSHLNYDVFGAYGESQRRQQRQGYVGLSRVRQALLATNNTTCLNTANNCVPLNLFGPSGSITPAQAAFLTEDSSIVVADSLAQAGAKLYGDLGFTVPSATSPVGFAVGAEYRKYKASQQPDALGQQAGELGGAGAAFLPIQGGYDVKEAYGELAIPLVQDKSFFRTLSLEAGIRYSSYKVDAASNPHYNTTTYKGGLTWEPVDGLKLRGNYSRAVRAPNISELFSPLVVAQVNLSFDPCAGAAPVTNANLRAVCLAQGAPAFSIGSINNPSGGQANAAVGGKTSLTPEKADTYSFGAIFEPRSIRGLSITADYYHILIRNAITAPTPLDSIVDCFGSLSAASATTKACTIIRRNPDTGGLDGDTATTPGLFQQQANTGRIETSGIDVSLNFDRKFGQVHLGVGFQGNYVFNAKFQSIPTGVNRECAGYYSVNCDSISQSIQPKYYWSQRTTVGIGGIDLSLLWRHLAPAQQEPYDATNPNASGPAYVGPVAGFGNQNFGRIGAYDYFDLTGRFNITPHFTLTISAENLFDKQPPLTGVGIGGTAYNSGNTFPSTYDTLGRRFVATVRVRY